MGRVTSVNVGRPRPVGARGRMSGIDKRPVDGPVHVSAPAGKGGGLAEDAVCDARHHGGPDQAVYAYAREDLDTWERQLGRALTSGGFGENLTTEGVDVTGAEVGELWRVGPSLLLQVTQPRVPCRTFAGWLGERGWMRTFTAAAVPGAYLRVLEPGEVRRGDGLRVEHRPGHGVTMQVAFRALLTEPALLPRLLDAPELPTQTRGLVLRRLAPTTPSGPGPTLLP
ncbi:MOSC domain-containing protein [Motilibacter deserti]|uniref:MOSC domain-containing protein n=1 Tax=Motilibacter deserti TaxID=2714956 RepID=A0ABX0GVH6_9ACTN|nr:MOSC domain-containing protein [Motilibacter deserti]NHC14545.1 MOSC domain-containing protein [Motilibacter deserti]